MPRDEDFLAAAFNPIIGQSCTTYADEVTLSDPGSAVRMWAFCGMVSSGAAGEKYLYSFQTSPERPAFLGSTQCNTASPDVGDTWMGASIRYACKHLPGITESSPQAGVFIATRVTPEELDQAEVLRVDVYRTAVEQPLGEPCPTAGATLATFDAGTADLAITCRDVIAGRSFYHLEITPTSHYGWSGSPGYVPDGNACNDIGNRSSTGGGGYPLRVTYCAELDQATAAAVVRRVTWTAEPPSHEKACTKGDADIEEIQDHYRFTLACKSMHGPMLRTVVYATKME
ncbi:hypothetical protein [Frankia sp. ACN1ag]|uniref:hypothetical protein n=1 Tax=Frankia sp. ACN1ag TaxID=102891 RepID=UPI0006DD083D|nr:hypothetical protein [Frankia sp. ACN1ag]KQC37858.1 hypothetical protein UK82_12675 [Frankia sp. ACN1ag]